MDTKASSVSTSDNVARIAANESALPASVPPTPPTSSTSASPEAILASIASATSSVIP